MEFSGFKNIKDRWGIAIDFAMPPILQSAFFSRLYCRGALCDSAEGSPLKTWRQLAPEYGSNKIAAPTQVHGTHIIEAGSAAALPDREEADGILIESGDSALGSLRFADCTPVVIAGIAGDTPWLVMLHSGFQGTLKNICAHAAKKVFAKYPMQRPGEIWAWIGPAIGPECYSRKLDDPATAKALAIFQKENILEDGEDSDTCRFDIKGEIFLNLQVLKTQNYKGYIG